MNEYRYSRYFYRPKRKKKKFVFVFLFLFLIGGGVVYSILFIDIYAFYSRIVDMYRLLFDDFSFLEKHLATGNYNIVIHEGTPYLEKRPYNARLIRYMGEAYYYISTGLTDQEREESIERAIILLRKGIVLSRFESTLPKYYFILGMAYFRKGSLYYELAAQYLKKAFDAGHKDNSIYEILGYCYYRLGVFDDAITNFEKAVELSQKDVVRLFLAHSYKNKGLYESSLQLLNYLIESSQDDAILEEAYSALAWIDFQEERYDQASEKLYKVLDMNVNSAYAHFWLGNIFEMQGDKIAARKEWRKTLKIDPKHIGAIEKLY